mmetsp:Transcript_37704/g.76251  ORF Transcript_37704/g.76251 Transcript_37704/m.76251 type:complete len:374 (+) Transcript_37704:1007-2128(+)
MNQKYLASCNYSKLSNSGSIERIVEIVGGHLQKCDQTIRSFALRSGKGGKKNPKEAFVDGALSCVQGPIQLLAAHAEYTGRPLSLDFLVVINKEVNVAVVWEEDFTSEGHVDGLYLSFLAPLAAHHEWVQEHAYVSAASARSGSNAAISHVFEDKGHMHDARFQMETIVKFIASMEKLASQGQPGNIEYAIFRKEGDSNIVMQSNSRSFDSLLATYSTAQTNVRKSSRFGRVLHSLFSLHFLRIVISFTPFTFQHLHPALSHHFSKNIAILHAHWYHRKMESNWGRSQLNYVPLIFNNMHPNSYKTPLMGILLRSSSRLMDSRYFNVTFVVDPSSLLMFQTMMMKCCTIVVVVPVLRNSNTVFILHLCPFRHR